MRSKPILGDGGPIRKGEGYREVKKGPVLPSPSEEQAEAREERVLLSGISQHQTGEIEPT